MKPSCLVGVGRWPLDKGCGLFYSLNWRNLWIEWIEDGVGGIMEGGVEVKWEVLDEEA